VDQNTKLTCLKSCDGGAILREESTTMTTLVGR